MTAQCKLLLEDTGEEILLDLSLNMFRNVSVGYLATTIRQAERAEAIGPILRPNLWPTGTMTLHHKKAQVLRRCEELRRALEELDEAQAEFHPNATQSS